jgi:hypothetical protein
VGGAVVFWAGRLPTPADFDQMASLVPQLVSTALRYSR